jgi:hypothetical protein
MNYALRVMTREHIFVLEQSRPWIEKFPNIVALLDQALHQGVFYARAVRQGPFRTTPHFVVCAESGSSCRTVSCHIPTAAFTVDLIRRLLAESS